MTKKPTPAPKENKFPDLLGQLATSLAEHALENQPGSPPVPFDQKLDAFKALTTYFVGTTRVKAKQPNDGDDSGINFASIRRSLADASSGSGSNS